MRDALIVRAASSVLSVRAAGLISVEVKYQISDLVSFPPHLLPRKPSLEDLRTRRPSTALAFGSHLPVSVFTWSPWTGVGGGGVSAASFGLSAPRAASGSSSLPSGPLQGSDVGSSSPGKQMTTKYQ
ncbi:hypothetical protein EYF80_035094 [Liparis tanakae]|uniref:Uncharacterized protein n=1 Tax=Liparis tanakae TaxID=230148 RepID=A0A4Z2GN63_9TELE|nr:hypothetical protein EYF80_035094 [Liparis tanakae]